MASNECYHFTKLNRAYGISKNGLVPRLEANSKAVNDSASKISFSDGKLAAAGLFSNFYNVFKSMKDKKRNPTDKKVMSSEDVEAYLGEGIYLVFDGSNIENTGGNRGHINPFDAATRTAIKPSDLKVCVLRDNDGNIHYSQYDYIKYIIKNLTEDDYKELQEMDKSGEVRRSIEEYKSAYKSDIEQFSREEYTPELMSLEEFVEKYKLEIDSNISEYVQTYIKDTQEEINKLNKEFENMPTSIKEMLSKCQEQYEQMIEELMSMDLSEIEIPIPGFYELYRDNFDNLINQYCSSVVESSQEEVTKLREEVEQMPEYKELFLHSNLHIQNVVEFAYIIGKSENTLGDDLDLLVQAAKYHDSGREESEWLSDNHADPSAEHAAEELSKTGRYTPEQIAMIKVAIRYHEHGEMFKNEFDEEYFKEISSKDGVPNEKLEITRLMCIYLKDADALDRVRLGNLDVSYLRTSVAKSDTFLKEFGKDKESISWEDAGLAVKRNKDFNIEQELLDALEKLKKDYSEKKTILSEIEKIENRENEKASKGGNRNIFSMINKIRHILQTEKIVESILENVDEIKINPERKDQYLKWAIENFSKKNIDTLKVRLTDAICLSKIQRKSNQENISKAVEVEEISDGSVQFIDDSGEKHLGNFSENIVPVFNDSGFAVQKFGELLGVKVAKRYECEYQGKQRIVSQDISEDFDRFITMKDIIKKSNLPKIYMNNAKRTEPSEYNPKGMVESPKEIEEMFELPLRALEELGISKEDMNEITRDYVRMICFDYLTNQTDRNEDSYGILMKNGKVSFAPLKNYEKVLKDPTDKENDINFIDNIRCDRTILMSIVASKYPELVQEFFELAIENKTQISNILSESFLPDMQEKYGSIIYENISELQRIIEQVKSKDIVDYSKSESHFSKEKIDRIAKQKEVALEDENSNEIISEIEKLCERQNENQNPTLE